MNLQVLSPSLDQGLLKKTFFLRELLHVIGGSLFFAACSQISIPLYPVPISLQTFFVFLLPLFLGRNKAVLALLFYLAEATMGLPVLAGGVIEPLWFLGTRAGYLLSWPICAYLIGSIITKKRCTSLRLLSSFIASQVLIYGLGALFLSRFFSFEMSVKLGIFPFLPSAVLKVIVATLVGGFYFRIPMGKVESSSCI